METSGSNGRALRIEGLVNVRDLGGLRRNDRALTPTGVFYRSENLDWVGKTGWDELHAAGIRTVVDLRQQQERDSDTQARPAWLTSVHVDLDGIENEAFWNDFWDNGLVGTALYFLPHIQAMPQRLGAALSAIANAKPGGVLFHCMGGRDRTGLVAMALLVAAGVEPEDIVDDYLETVRLGDTRAAQGNCNNSEPALEELCRQNGTTTEGAFRDALDGFNLEEFFAAAKLSADEREALLTWRGSLPRK
ncbi:tyrosine protein phosphatase [Arthrobacter sp. SW1]|uniref:tyrosine-protein phosphatase n=1 Tax=Arthrobacter sp. SW1 TaxID=1920889 RepID=UPI000877E465|nr:tyrosine-protein phosphatase [Arthrobacter sp. SW1]OFI37050.1 tyrosine protein phosphatase [Arthrobacter sp. SW1]